MATSRRHFLQDAAIVAAATAFPCGALAAIPAAIDNENALANLSAATFEPWIQSRFEVSRNSRSEGSLLLIAVNEAKPVKAGATPGNRTVGPGISPLSALTTPKVDSFTLQFQRTGAPLPQETYTLKHAWLGTFQLLLVPSGIGGRISTCSAVFSLLFPA
jgi:hypothetical protein